MLCCLGDTTVTCISELLYVSLLSSAFHCRNGTTTKLSSDGSAFASTAHKQQGDERGLYRITRDCSVTCQSTLHNVRTKGWGRSRSVEEVNMSEQ